MSPGRAGRARHRAGTRAPPADRRADRAWSRIFLASSTTWCAYGCSVTWPRSTGIRQRHLEEARRLVTSRSSARKAAARSVAPPARHEPRIDFRYESEAGRSRLRPRQYVDRRRRRGITGDADGGDGFRGARRAPSWTRRARTPACRSSGAPRCWRPEAEQDIINCSTHDDRFRRSDRRWQDKVMVDLAMRTGLRIPTPRSSTTPTVPTPSCPPHLVAYNCYSPPRTAREFRAFADLDAASPVIGGEHRRAGATAHLLPRVIPTAAAAALREESATCRGLCWRWASCSAPTRCRSGYGSAPRKFGMQAVD